MFSPPGPRKPAHCHTRPTHNANVTHFASDQMGTVVPTWHSSKCACAPEQAGDVIISRVPRRHTALISLMSPFLCPTTLSLCPLAIASSQRQPYCIVHSAMHSCSIIAVHQVHTYARRGLDASGGLGCTLSPHC